MNDECKHGTEGGCSRCAFAQEFVIFDVDNYDPIHDSWDICLGNDKTDPWLTVTREQIGREPRRGDVIKVIPPEVIGLREFGE